MGFGDCTCEHCEELMQPYLDRELTQAEQAEAETHLEHCTYCRRRYRFEEDFRMYVKVAWREEMPPELKAKLVALRLPDP
jgi:anti-sigma factor (TIGR02949 family)